MDSTAASRLRRLRRRAPVQPLKQDKLAVGLLAASILLWAGLLVWLVTSFESFPDLLPLHFDAQGFPDRIGERRELYVLPAIGFVVNLLNLGGGILARNRLGMIFAAYLLWSGALLVQLLLWTALWNLVR